MSRVLIAMSGGVDSSAAALLMQQRGYECVGCTMKLYDNEDAGIERLHTCCSLDDVEDARSVAFALGMRYYVFNFGEEFREKVIDNFTSEYLHGRTPNPCIACNRYLKFGKLFERAKQLDCTHVVTGHYARIEEQNGKYVLKKALDETKDQSYVLYAMTQDELAHTLFPLGEYRKSEIRRLTEAHHFINANKPDSQDICFVPDGDYVKAIDRFCGKTDTAGNFVSLDGEKIAEHEAYIKYTVGQRRGLGVPAGQRLYVCRIRPDTHEVVLGRNEDLFSYRAELKDVHWISGLIPTGAVECKVKIRYRHTEQPAQITMLDDRRAVLEFQEPQRAITPGQAAVFYMDDVVLGGGIIEKSM